MYNFHLPLKFRNCVCENSNKSTVSVNITKEMLLFKSTLTTKAMMSTILSHC